MYLQVQVPIPIHGNTIECAVIINFISLKTLKNPFSWLIEDKQQNWYLYNILDRFRYHQSWYWSDTNTDTRIGAALLRSVILIIQWYYKW